MIRKHQEGGQLTDTQQQGLQYLALMYAQQTGKDPQQDLEGFMLFVQQLAQQAGVQDIGQLLDMIYLQAQGQAQAAKRGAKLNYLKRLMGKCPEGYELQYFAFGGKACSQCVAKKKVEKEACGKKVKKNCGGKKIKFLNGDKINDRADYSKPNKKITASLSGKKINLTVNEGLLYGEDPINIKGQNYYLTGDSTLIRSNLIKNSKKITNKVVKDLHPAGPLTRARNRISKLKNEITSPAREYDRTVGNGGRSSRGGGGPVSWETWRFEDAGDGYSTVMPTKDGYKVIDDVGKAFRSVSEESSLYKPYGYYGNNNKVYTQDGKVFNLETNEEILLNGLSLILPKMLYLLLDRKYKDYSKRPYIYYDHPELHPGGNQVGGVR